MSRGGNYKFTSKKQSENGILSTVLGFISFISFFAAMSYSFRNAGNVGMRFGAVGLLALIFSFIGLVLGFISLGEQEVFTLFPRLGTVVSVLSFLCWIWVILVGTGYVMLC